MQRHVAARDDIAKRCHFTRTFLRRNVGTSRSWPSTIVGSLFSKRPRVTGSNCITSCSRERIFLSAASLSCSIDRLFLRRNQTRRRFLNRTVALARAAVSPRRCNRLAAVRLESVHSGADFRQCGRFPVRAQSLPRRGVAGGSSIRSELQAVARETRSGLGAGSCAGIFRREAS